MIEFAIEVYRKREMDELILKVELDPGADPAVTTERLRRDIHRDLQIRAAIESVPAGSLPRFELKSKRLRILD